MTLKEAREWADGVWRQRTWWVEALFGEPKEDSGKTKPCRHPAACAMCKKRCGQRISE